MISTTPARELSDTALLSELEQCAELRRRVDARVAELAGEVKARSSFEAGYAGLAQSKGARTPEVLVQQTTGLSKAESNALVRVGSKPDFLAPVDAGVFGVAKVDAVRGGLGVPTESVTADDLLLAATRVAEEARDLTVEQAAAHARAIRDELDAENVLRREQEQREARSMSVRQRLDGLWDIHLVADTEIKEIIVTAVDSIVAPRRGGPRFVDKAKAAEQKRWETEDTRTVPQMMVDALADLVALAVQAADGVELTGGKGSVSVHVTAQTLIAGIGPAHFEGNPDLISPATAQRFSCNTEITMVNFDRGFAIDVGRDQRLFTRKQRVAIYARDGGCMFPGCDRPPKFTEVHHINEWEAQKGRTDTADGILLCRHHHMLLHNNGWAITRTAATYYLHAPDGDITELRSKSPLYRQHRGGAHQATPPQPPGLPQRANHRLTA